VKTLRGSVTIDSNPEGVNQYTAAAGAAEVASTKANELSKTAQRGSALKKAVEAHNAASIAHSKAAAVAPDQEKKEMHEKKSGRHRDQSSNLSYMIGPTRHRVKG